MQNEFVRDDLSIKVEKENREYAKILMQDYAGPNGALSAILRYSFQQMIQKDPQGALSRSLFFIQKMKMKELEILGRLIYLLGETPIYATYDSHISRTIPYTTSALCYEKSPASFLEFDIQKEEKILEQYIAHQKLIKDSYIQDILKELIQSQELILEKLQELSLFYFSSN